MTAEPTRFGQRKPRWFIGPDHLTTYMRRWFVQTPWCSIGVHKILRSDNDREMHDHPMDFWTFLLWGSYAEVLAEAPKRWTSRIDLCGQNPPMLEKWWRAGAGLLGSVAGLTDYVRLHVDEDHVEHIVRRRQWSLRKVMGPTLHRLLLFDGPVWTIVLRGPKYRAWGFQTDSGWIPYEAAPEDWQHQPPVTTPTKDPTP